MKEQNVQDFSIREEVRIELTENLRYVNLSVDEVLEDVVNDELLLNMITLTIYKTIQEKLEARNEVNKDVEHGIAKTVPMVVADLLNRGII